MPKYHSFLVLHSLSYLSNLNTFFVSILFTFVLYLRIIPIITDLPRQADGYYGL